MPTPTPLLPLPPFKDASYRLARDARQHIQRLDEEDPVENRTRIDFDPTVTE